MVQSSAGSVAGMVMVGVGPVGPPSDLQGSREGWSGYGPVGPPIGFGEAIYRALKGQGVSLLYSSRACLRSLSVVKEVLKAPGYRHLGTPIAEFGGKRSPGFQNLGESRAEVHGHAQRRQCEDPLGQEACQQSEPDRGRGPGRVVGGGACLPSSLQVVDSYWARRARGKLTTGAGAFACLRSLSVVKEVARSSRRRHLGTPIAEFGGKRCPILQNLGENLLEVWRHATAPGWADTRPARRSRIA